MDKYIDIEYVLFSEFSNLEHVLTFKSFNQYNKIQNYTYSIYNYVNSLTYVGLLKYTNPYEFLYSSFRDIEYMISRYFSFKKNNNSDTIKKYDILYYKLTSVASIYLYELNYKYKLINENTYNIYDITNKSDIADTCILINNIHYPTKKYNYTQIIPTFISHIQRIEYIKNKGFHIHEIEKIFTDTISKLGILLTSIKTIDFCHIHLDVMNFVPARNYNAIVREIFNLYIFAKIYSRISIGGNLCFTFRILDLHYSSKIITIMAHAFEEYYITLPEIVTEKDGYFYVILKNKKDITKSYTEFLEQLAVELETKVLSAKILSSVPTEKLSNTDVLKRVELTDGEMIYKIKLRNKKLKKLEKQIKKKVIKCNNLFYSRLKKVFDLTKKIDDLIKHNKFTEDIKNKYLELNLFECINWSKKYDMPLTVNGKNLTHILSANILGYLFSYDKKIEFIFKKHAPENKLKIDTNIDISSIPKIFETHLSKFLFENDAAKKQNTDIYYKIKTDIDYYYKKKINKINKIYGIKNLPSTIWLKIFEIYNEFDIIPKTSTNFKSFHFCDDTSSYIYATDIYIKKKTNIKEWIKNAHYFDEYDNTDKILKKYKELYDNGPNNNGDIIDHTILEYYSNKYGDNDLITAGCGLSYMQNDTPYILTYSIFLSIFISLKIGGSIIIRRQIPISDNQDLFLLYLTYTVFDKMIMYKPIIYQEAQEYFLIGIGYKGLSKEIMDELKNRHTKYVATGLIDITKIPDNFATQLYRCQEMFLNVFVEFIQNKIYFTNNYQKISENEWKILKQSSKSKIKDWIKNNFAEKMM